MVIFGGIQFRDVKSGDLLDIIQYIRKNTKFELVNTMIWHYKNGMSAHRFFANRCVGHPTQNPVAIIERFIKALSYPCATVLDFFAGSGTVGRVCINEGRNCLIYDSDNILQSLFR